MLLGCSLVVLLTGCSERSGSDGEPSGAAAPSGDRAASPVASDPVVSAPAAPAYVAPSVAPSLPATDIDTSEQGREFVLAYFETLNYGYATGDADPLRAVTSLSCFTCQQWIIEIATLQEEGLTREGGSLLVSTIGTVGQAVGGGYQFRVELDRLPGQVTDASGENTLEFGASTEFVDITVGLQTSGLTGETTWTTSSVTAPAV